MRCLEDIIKDYSNGEPYSELGIEELISFVFISDILERAHKYGVKYEDFETSEYEVRNYLYDLHQMREDYNIIKDDMRKEGDLMLLFNIIVSSIICYLVYEITHYISFALWIVVIIFTYLIPYGLFKYCYERLRVRRLFKKNGFVRKKNIEEYVNEIMYQIYMENRNPKLEREFKKRHNI